MLANRGLRCFLMLIAFSLAAPSYGYTLARLFGFESRGGGCHDCCEPTCGCEPSCGCAPAPVCEPSCGCASAGCCDSAGVCQPGCGSGTVCDCPIDGRKLACCTWDCCGERGPELCACTGPTGACHQGGCCGGGNVGCGDCCEPSCACEPSCDCEPACGCDQGGCGGGKSWFGCGILKALCKPCWGCNGCDPEFYWSEWHNDPPRCCDPCDRCGNWVGPPGTGYRAPYSHEYAVHSVAAPARHYHAGRSSSPPASGKVVRKPQVGPQRTYQR